MENGTDDVLRIDIRIVQLSGRKRLTTIEGVPEEMKSDMLKTLKKKKCCGGSISKQDGAIQLQGDFSYEIEADIQQLLKGMTYEISMHGKKI